MLRKLLQGLVRAELEDQAAVSLKTVLWVYGAMGAAGAVFGVGAAIKSFVDRVDRLESKLSVLDQVIVEQEKKAEQERQVRDAYVLLSSIDRAKRLTSEHEAAEKTAALEREVVRELVRQRMARAAQ